MGLLQKGKGIPNIVCPTSGFNQLKVVAGILEQFWLRAANQILGLLKLSSQSISSLL